MRRIDADVNRPTILRLTRSAFVIRLSSSQFDGRWLENLNVMTAMMYSVAEAVAETLRHLIAFPVYKIQNYRK